MTSPIQAAIEQLRADYAEIPEWQRAQRWHASDLGLDIEHWWLEAGDMSIANFGQGVQAQHDAERVARMASPGLTTALIAHLEAVADDHEDTSEDSCHALDDYGCNDPIHRAAVALAEAITHRSDHGR